MTTRARTTVGALLFAAALATPAWGKGRPDPANQAARAACAAALARGDLDALRIAWTQWLDRSVSLTVEVKGGKLSRYGGLLKNQRSERALSGDERKALLEALRTARVDRLVWTWPAPGARSSPWAPSCASSARGAPAPPRRWPISSRSGSPPPTGADPKIGAPIARAAML